MAKKKEKAPSLKGVAVFVVVGIVLLALLFLIPTLTKKEEPAKPELRKPAVNPDAAQFEDIVSINYVLRLEDNTIVDANGNAARNAGLKNYVAGPYSFVLGRSLKVKGFDEAVVGMLPGEQKTVTILPTEPVTRVLINRTKEMFKSQPVSRISFFPIEKFKELFSKPPIVNDVIWNKEMPYKLQVINFSEKKVAARALVKEGEVIQLPGLPWKSKIIGVYDRIITVFHEPKDSMVIDTAFGSATIDEERSRYYVHYNATVGQLVNYSINLQLKGTVTENEVEGFVVPHMFKVTSVTNETITIEREDNLAEKKLTLDVTLLELRKQ